MNHHLRPFLNPATGKWVCPCGLEFFSDLIAQTCPHPATGGRIPQPVEIEAPAGWWTPADEVILRGELAKLGGIRPVAPPIGPAFLCADRPGDVSAAVGPRDRRVDRPGRDRGRRRAAAHRRRRGAATGPAGGHAEHLRAGRPPLKTWTAPGPVELGQAGQGRECAANRGSRALSTLSGPSASRSAGRAFSPASQYQNSAVKINSVSYMRGTPSSCLMRSSRCRSAGDSRR